MLPVHLPVSPPMIRKIGTPIIPQFFKWRDGRPRWEPSPRLRELGYRARDLKNDDGAWMNIWEACAAAEEINALIKTGHADELKSRATPRSLAALFDTIEASPKFRDAAPGERRQVRRLSRDTRSAYRGYYKVLRTWAGDQLASKIEPGDVDALYEKLVEQRGHVSANRCIAAFSTAMNYARDKLRWIAHNPCAGLDKIAEDGRLVMWTPEENTAFVLAADWMGLYGVGDAHVVALLSGQSRIDVLGMPELDLSAPVHRLPRHKVSSTTAKVAFVPSTAPLLARLHQARARKAMLFPGVVYRHEIIDYRTGAPYNLEGSVFTEQHRMVRAVASGLQPAIESLFPLRPAAGEGAQISRAIAPLDYAAAPFDFVPSIWLKKFADLRDTAVTLLIEATQGDMARVANITAHSLRTVQKMADKHYFVRNEGMSVAAGGQLEQLMKRLGYTK